MRVLLICLLLTSCGNNPVEFSGKTRTMSNTASQCFTVPATGAYSVEVVDGKIMEILESEGNK